ncbi:MAG: NADH-quinone oxidoreductase subunit NuoF [Elusimicrobiota bacterium]
MNFTELKQTSLTEWGKIKNPSGSATLIFVGMATCGKSAGAEEVISELKKNLSIKKIKFEIISVGCIGLCYLEPLVDVVKHGKPRVCFGKVTVENVSAIVDYILSDKIPKKLVIGTIGEKPLNGIPALSEIPYMKYQVRRILKRCGFIDPENIYHYIANDGYSGLENALKMSPDEIIDEIKKSGLRGRGGAGFPTGIKWAAGRQAGAEEQLQTTTVHNRTGENYTCSEQRRGKLQTKYIICNADEGDPGAFMNRALLESDPHSVLEGMLIAGYAIGAEEGYIYCRAEYPLALRRLNIALKQMDDLKLIGEKILNSKFNFKIHIKEGAGAFVCGEETALIHSIEGKRGAPRARPPFPVEKGLRDKPTVINNVETLANVSIILQNSARWFAEYGTEKSKGTKTFCLVGKIKNTGLIEVPLGTTLKRVIYDIGDGIPEDKKFKAIQIGGPSGGCIPKNLLDLPIDYESLTSAGAIMGSGGMIVIDENNCVVDLAKYFLSFTQKESCGKCVPCRVGTKQMLNILEKITNGSGVMNDLIKLQELAKTIKLSSLCGLGQTSPNPVLTTIKYFYNEYEAHIKDKKCPAKVCKSLITYSVITDKCNGCHLCFKNCPQEPKAISGEPKKTHRIIQAKCIKCGICFDVCKQDAIKIE